MRKQQADTVAAVARIRPSQQALEETCVPAAVRFTGRVQLANGCGYHAYALCSPGVRSVILCGILHCRRGVGVHGEGLLAIDHRQILTHHILELGMHAGHVLSVAIQPLIAWNLSHVWHITRLCVACGASQALYRRLQPLGVPAAAEDEGRAGRVPDADGVYDEPNCYRSVWYHLKLMTSVSCRRVQRGGQRAYAADTRCVWSRMSDIRDAGAYLNVSLCMQVDQQWLAQVELSTHFTALPLAAAPQACAHGLHAVITKPMSHSHTSCRAITNSLRSNKWSTAQLRQRPCLHRPGLFIATSTSLTQQIIGHRPGKIMALKRAWSLAAAELRHTRSLCIARRQEGEARVKICLIIWRAHCGRTFRGQPRNLWGLVSTGRVVTWTSGWMCSSSMTRRSPYTQREAPF